MDTATSKPQPHIDLTITGMTCAACAVCVERVLNRLPGVNASVNFATETARVDTISATIAPDVLISAVEKAGYGAHLKTAQAMVQYDAMLTNPAQLKHAVEEAGYDAERFHGVATSPMLMRAIAHSTS